ncbi:homoprotocatechuate degradation operon regulator HpaR [Maritimibacter sp. UBA3975]|uniref:homoprotocatechuate degradation operon regulator HpaR n=1 Tax=Maritimibacter sp. UBA3975 TaxID=1946833 RepID=UPI000C093D90|nr:homoprotocatechuate degradation operon regulator HpaR [Maritimibacter sp. UBA3975]MAM61358.1 homoprotocatechuate degradation operon regulator HpaR [Maritimibacter sp.]
MSNPKLRDGFELSETRRTLPIALLRLRERLMSEFRPILTAHGTTEQQWRVLRVLMEAGEIDATELAERACILPPSLSRILKTLDAKGQISMDRNPGDGRRARIRLTAEGDGFIRTVSPESSKAYERIEARIGRARIDSLLNDLDAAIRALDAD